MDVPQSDITLRLLTPSIYIIIIVSICLGWRRSVKPRIGGCIYSELSWGMIVVNSFLAFVFFCENESITTLKKYVNALAVALSTLYVWKAI